MIAQSHILSNPLVHFDAIVNSKHSPTRETLRNWRPAAVVEFPNYLANSNALTAIRAANLSAAERVALLNAYDHTTIPLEQMKTEILENQSGALKYWCPYCAIGEVSTFDHFLPKALFPEFAVLCLNLIPACHKCNGYKSSKLNGRNGQLFLNLYFDSIPTHTYLVASVVWKIGFPTLEFHLANPGQISPSIFLRIQSHFAELHLLERFGMVSARTITRAVESLRPPQTKCASSILSVQTDLFRRTYPPNYWETAGLLALSNDVDFLNMHCKFCQKPH